MKEQKNIELFEIYAAKTLGLLYDEFPIPKNFNYHEFCDNKSIEDALSQALIAYHTIEWLSNNGFIVHSGIDRNYGDVKRAVLTLKGLELLKYDFLGSKLKDALRLGKEELIRQAVNKIFSLSALGLGKLIGNL